jgi:hypothetical protein
MQLLLMAPLLLLLVMLLLLLVHLLLAAAGGDTSEDSDATLAVFGDATRPAAALSVSSATGAPPLRRTAAPARARGSTLSSSEVFAAAEAKQASFANDAIQFHQLQRYVDKTLVFSRDKQHAAAAAYSSRLSVEVIISRCDFVRGPHSQ